MMMMTIITMILMLFKIMIMMLMLMKIIMTIMMLMLKLKVIIRPMNLNVVFAMGVGTKPWIQLDKIVAI